LVDRQNNYNHWKLTHISGEVGIQTSVTTFGLTILIFCQLIYDLWTTCYLLSLINTLYLRV